MIVAAGATIGPGSPTRRDLGATNRVVFEHIADQCVTRLSKALFIVVSNPVELAVEIPSLAIDRKRVIGMGAQQDSMRFARAIAADLCISRHDIRATVMEEHGQAMIPLWRSVELVPGDSRATGQLAELWAQSNLSPLETRVAALALGSEPNLVGRTHFGGLRHGRAGATRRKDFRRALHHGSLHAFDSNHLTRLSNVLQPRWQMTIARSTGRWFWMVSCWASMEFAAYR